MSGEDDQLVLVPVAGGAPVPISGTEGADAASCSPDGSRIAFSVNEYSSSPLDPGIYTVSLSGGAPRLVVATPSRDASDSLPVFSPDGTKIAFTRDVFDSKGNETVALELVSVSVGAPQALTTGRLARRPQGRPQDSLDARQGLGPFAHVRARGASGPSSAHVLIR